MKKITKLLSIMMVLAMVLSLGVSALAATVVVDKDAGNAFTAWQIFAGSTDNNDPNNGAMGHLGDIKWGSAVASNSAAFVKALIAGNEAAWKNVGLNSNPFGGLTEGASAKDVGAVLDGEKDASAVAEYFAQVAYEFLKDSDGIQLVAGENKLDDGYYLIVEDGDSNGNGVINPALLQLTDEGSFYIQKKADFPKVDKEVEDTNDTDGKSEWGDSADRDIGDDVSFRLTATIGQGYAKFETYYLEFVDTMSVGLTYNNDAVVKIGDQDVTSSFTIGTTKDADGRTVLSVKCQDLKAAGLNVTDNTDIVVTYTAKLNDKAVVGKMGNTNDVYLKYTNNPNEDQGGDPKGTTPHDTVIVFTFDQLVEKVDAMKQPLKGAEFTLYKKLNAKEDGAVNLGDDTTTWWKPLTTVATGDDANQFSFKGIDDGEYRLVETKVPEGYNKAEDIDFMVEATHEDPDNHNGNAKGEALTGFKVSVWDGTKWVEQHTITDPKTDEEKQQTVLGVDMDTDNGMINGQVVNNNGMELPETGGIGTTIFYVIGAILVVGAVILLVTRKRVGEK